MASFAFAVVSPERQAFEGEVSSVSLRSAGGDIGFLAGHVPYIGVVRVSVCEIVPDHGEPLRLAVHGGFVEVAPDGTVTLLADIVERAEEIDVARAQAAQERATSVSTPEPDPEVEAALARAEVRLEVAAPAASSSGRPGSPTSS
jgi:F-type H+-transporting ATPase subunit epsilon